MSDRGEWFITRSGKQFFIQNPRPEDVDIKDIAHALSNLCRFGGHCSHFYSVAQHSLMVCDMLPPALKLHGLLHDATEAYLGDVIRPLKRLMPTYSVLEKNLSNVIASAFGLHVLPERDYTHIKDADNTALMIERASLIKPGGPEWVEEAWAIKDPPKVLVMHPHAAEHLFLKRFEQLMEKRKAPV